MASLASSSASKLNKPTEAELTWAKALKKAATGENLAPLSDLYYLQYSIIAKGNLSKGLKRIRHMQTFSEKYKIFDDTFVSREESLKFLFDSFPEMLPPVGTDVSGRKMIAIQPKFFFPGKKLQSHKDYCLFLKAILLIWESKVLDVEDMRRGIAIFENAEDMGFSNFSMEAFRQIADFLQNAYPIKVKKIAFVNASWFLGTVLGIIKTFLSAKLRSRLEVFADVAEVLIDEGGEEFAKKENTETNEEDNEIEVTFRVRKTEAPIPYGGKFTLPTETTIPAYILYCLEQRKQNFKDFSLHDHSGIAEEDTHC